jgi:hypothetical protein
MPIPLGIFAVAGAISGPAGAYEQIATQLVSSSVATVSLSSIPSTYSHLQVRFTCKSSSGSAPLNMWVNFNGDNGANYAFHALAGFAPTTMSGQGYATTANIELINASISSQDNRFGAGIIDILDYRNTTKNKTIRSIHGVHADANNGIISIGSGHWRNTSAITSITFAANGGGTRTIESGSRFSVYGIKG